MKTLEQVIMDASEVQVPGLGGYKIARGRAAAIAEAVRGWMREQKSSVASLDSDIIDALTKRIKELEAEVARAAKYGSEMKLDEQSYIQGSRAAWTDLLRVAMRNLGYEDVEKEKFAVLHSETIAALRSACAKLGDNDWPDDLHPTDIIGKHLLRHIAAGEFALPD